MKDIGIEKAIETLSNFSFNNIQEVTLKEVEAVKHSRLPKGDDIIYGNIPKNKK